MNMRTPIVRLALAGLLFSTGWIAFAAEPIYETDDEVDLCQPFMDGKVDSSLLATMLSAAENGHLYRIQTATSRMGFCVSSQLTEIEGEFTDFRGGLALQAVENDAGLAMLVIKTDSVDVKGKVIENLIKGESFFDVDNNPEILFVSKGFKWIGPDRARLRGDLTMRGITHPVVFDVTLTDMDDDSQNSKTDKILVKATTEIDRTEFGMDALPSLVDTTVRLCMSVEALKYRSGST